MVELARNLTQIYGSAATCEHSVYVALWQTIFVTDYLAFECEIQIPLIY